MDLWTVVGNDAVQYGGRRAICMLDGIPDLGHCLSRGGLVEARNFHFRLARSVLRFSSLIRQCLEHESEVAIPDLLGNFFVRAREAHTIS